MHTASAGVITPQHSVASPAPLAACDHIVLASIIVFLEARLLDSQQQAEREIGQGKAFYEGRVSAFELSLSELRGGGPMSARICLTLYRALRRIPGPTFAGRAAA